MNRNSLVASAVVVTVVVGGALLLKSNRKEAASGIQPAQAVAEPTAPQKALPRFVDLGTTSCAPCRVMIGVMAELRAALSGRDARGVRERQQPPEEAERYGVQVIPTQVFLSRMARSCSATWASFERKRSSRSGRSWASDDAAGREVGALRWTA